MSPEAAGTDGPRLIGEDGLPVRAIAFSSGGFDTAMQLGVVHAILTIQGKAPDAVVGCSAGAVNAVALAEILQAGSDPQVERDWDTLPAAQQQRRLEDRQRSRISRFRQILDAYLNARGEMVRAFAPDTLQVEARQPLAPLELPIHDQLEREKRREELRSRQGLINLINDLLQIRISFATLTKFIRRGLGARAAGEIRSTVGRYVATWFEIARTWSLVGVNLSRAAWVLRPLLKPFLSLSARPTGRGGTAGSIIFTARWRKEVRTALRHLLGVIALGLLWITTTVAGLTVPYLIARLVGGVIRLLGWVLHEIGLSWWVPFRAAATWIDSNILLASGILYGAAVAVAVYAFSTTAIWQQIVKFNRSSTLAILREVAWEMASLGLLLLVMVVLPILLFLAAVTWPDLVSWQNDVAPAFGWLIDGSWILLAALTVIAILLGVRKAQDNYVHRLLSRYDLHAGLLNAHPLRQFFVRLFDPDYYGERRMDDVVDRALRDDYQPSYQPTRDKLVRSYEAKGQSPPIAVGLMVANLAALRSPRRGTERTPDLVENVPPEAKVVDGLLAACAVSPFFPPVAVLDKLLIDAANVTVEATRGLLHLLRPRVNPESTVVHLYSVSALPFSSPALREEPSPGASAATARNASDPPIYLTLLDVAYRSILLQRFRDSALERRLTEMFTKALPVGKAVVQVNGSPFLRVWVAPVEPEEPLELNHRLSRCCTADEARTLIAETVADGCRAALEVMIRESLPKDPSLSTIKCRVAVKAHLKARKPSHALPLLADMEPAPPDAEESPGLPEVCRHCKLSARWAPAPGKAPPTRSLVIRPFEKVAPVWPHEYEKELPPTAAERAADPHFVMARTAYEQNSLDILKRFKETVETGRGSEGTDLRAAAEREWPRKRATGDGGKRPLVTFLFSGGVFRGVYQLGTLNALSEAGLEPDVIAGASIGSITAAMVAQAYCAPRVDANGRNERDARIARLAATYLAVDRLILTDRFADFVRGFTLRAAETRFSLRQADGFFRRYDHSSPAAFNREARMVVAGLERLFWLSPFEVKELAKAFRMRRPDRIYDLLRAHTQEWLERMGVGNQVLGAEPLELLIAEHVLQRIEGERWTDPNAIPFDRYLRGAGMYFLATTTNLTMGRLEVLGEQQLDEDGVSAFLKEGLLASSAFPGVFRPRWSWEVMPGTNMRHQYIDGGVMDNLPLDSVAQFLRNASEAGLVKPRPSFGGHDVPHMLFSASLEVNPAPPTIEELQRCQNEWPLVWKYAGQLKYNKKLDLFAETQRALRAIYEQTYKPKQQPFKPLDLEVVMVRPRWLCGTFGFHPMLGFRQTRQAESIAHGCATGLLELARVARGNPEWAAGWGLDPTLLPENPPVTDLDPIVPGPAGPGRCWFRPGVLCTFSAERLKGSGVPAPTIAELDRIHKACGQRKTHQPRET